MRVGRAAGRVPLLDRVIAAYYAAIDPATPVHVKGVLFAALAYFVLPADAIPDVLAGVGLTDDMAVLAVVMRTLASHIRAEHVARACAWLSAGGAGRRTA